ncbi:MAG: hypothetical protein EBS06_05915 [Proteobacteria bacterium]|nr:hypothetical protein [Pseudomonadota bacterium]
MKNLIWLHEDALSKNHLLFKQAPKNCLTFFVWDEEYFKEMDYSFKKLVFIFETLNEMDCEIYQGRSIEVIRQLAQENNSSEIFIAATPNPLLQSIATNLKDKIEIKIIAEKPFVLLKSEVNLKRFFNYWNKAKESAMTKDGGEIAAQH